MIQVTVHFYSYFRELTSGQASLQETVSEGATIEELLRQLFCRFPKLATMERSMLIAVGVEYQRRDYRLKNGEEISLFPPVQGG